MTPTTYKIQRGRAGVHGIWQKKPACEPVQVGEVVRIAAESGSTREHTFRATIGEHSATGASMAKALDALIAIRRRAGLK
jgi:hypothetical protein